MHFGVRKCLTNFTLTAKTLQLNTSQQKRFLQGSKYKVQIKLLWIFRSQTFMI